MWYSKTFFFFSLSLSLPFESKVNYSLRNFQSQKISSNFRSKFFFHSFFLFGILNICIKQSSKDKPLQRMQLFFLVVLSLCFCLISLLDLLYSFLIVIVSELFYITNYNCSYSTQFFFNFVLSFFIFNHNSFTKTFIEILKYF